MKYKQIPSLFIPASKHRVKRQLRHWFRWVLSTGQLPKPWFLQTYCRFRRIERLKNPAHLHRKEEINGFAFECRRARIRRQNTKHKCVLKQSVQQQKSNIPNWRNYFFLKRQKTHPPLTKKNIRSNLPITSKDAIVFAGWIIMTNFTRHIGKNAT